MKRFEDRFGVILLENHGSTECGVPSHAMPGDITVGTMGRPTWYMETQKYPEVMSTADIAELLSYAVTEIRVLARKGRIPAHREPGTHPWWFDRDEVIAWLSLETRVKPTERATRIPVG